MEEILKIDKFFNWFIDYSEKKNRFPWQINATVSAILEEQKINKLTSLLQENMKKSN